MPEGVTRHLLLAFEAMSNGGITVSQVEAAPDTCGLLQQQQREEGV